MEDDIQTNQQKILRKLKSSNDDVIPESYYNFDKLSNYFKMTLQKKIFQQANIEIPFFKSHEGLANSKTMVAGKEYLNFSSYNYLNLAGHPYVSEMAKKAIDQYGTSVSASRLVSGERPLHQQLEKAIANMLGVESCLTFVSGHATNVTTIGYLFGKNDLIIYDDLIHNSVVQGALLSGAKRLHYPHNDAQALMRILELHRNNFEKVLIVTESLFSMDGDIAVLNELIQIKKQYKCFLMVDEAHSIGVLGKRGFGIAEHFNIAAHDVDIWMGTLSKTLAGSGGYIAGSNALTEQLKYYAPGFVYSVGIAPPLAAASFAALQIMQQEPQRVIQLQQKSQLFYRLCQEEQLNTGSCAGFAIIPIIVGDSVRAIRLANALFEQGIHVQPIIYPGVAKSTARLRFFINCTHQNDDIYFTVNTIKQEINKLDECEKVGVF